MVNLSADVGTIFKQLLGKGGGKKPASKGAASTGGVGAFRNLILFAILAFAATGLYVKFYYLPKQKELKAQIEKLDATRAMKEELAQFHTQETALKKQLTEGADHFKEVIGGYEARGRIEELYDSISSIARAEDLVVANIRSNDGDGTLLQDTVYEKTVNLELQGRFQQFLAFRERLLEQKPLLAVKSETIEMNDSNQPGTVVIRLVLLDYSIDKATFQEVLNHAS